VATAICGDNYFAENQEKASRELFDLVKQSKPDGFIAGPLSMPADTDWLAEKSAKKWPKT